MDATTVKMSEHLKSAAEPLDTPFHKARETIHRQMLSAVSHDLKTPLASIIGSLEVYKRMKNRLPPEKQAALIGVALQEAYRLDSFIVNVLDMARLESGSLKSKKENAEIGALLRNCLARMEGPLQGISIHLESLAGPLDAYTDPVLLSRVVCLVLDNAIKYGGTPPFIRIEFGRSDSVFAYIRICDNGRGIPPDQLEAIFSKYTRLEREDQQNAGIGLGLAIARSVMQILDGHIAADNEPRGGAVFTIQIPVPA